MSFFTLMDLRMSWDPSSSLGNCCRCGTLFDSGLCVTQIPLEPPCPPGGLTRSTETLGVMG